MHAMTSLDMWASRARQAYAEKVPAAWDAELHLAIAGPDGEILVATDAGMSNGMRTALSTIRDFFGSDWSDGDIALSNDVFAGGSHPSEFTAVTPLFFGGRESIDGWCVLRTTFGDVGGWDLGNYTFRALDIWAEGVRIMPVKISRGGRLRLEIVEILRINSRTPHLNAACALGLVEAANALRQVRSQTGLIEAAQDRLAEAGARARGRLVSLPTGRKQRKVAVECRGIATADFKLEVSVNRETVSVRLVDVPPPSPEPVNATRSMVRDAVLRAICNCLDLDAQDVLGMARLCVVEIPEGTMLSAVDSVPVSHAGLTTCVAIEGAVKAAINDLGIGAGTQNSDRLSEYLRISDVDRETGTLTQARRDRTLAVEKALGGRI